MARPRPSIRGIATALVGVALAASGLGLAGSAGAAGAEKPYIVMMDPAADLGATVRDEQRRGNDVDATVRTIGKGFVAPRFY